MSDDIKTIFIPGVGYYYEPTMNIKFIDGKLYQMFLKKSCGLVAENEWRLVPSEVSHD